MNLALHMIQDQLALEKLQKFLQTNKLPHQDVRLSAGEKIFLGFYDDAGELVASGGLELYGDAALLRSVAVQETQRGRSLGKRMVDELIQRAQQLPVRRIFLLTESAPDFFQRIGFMPVDRGSVPPALQASSEFADVCPASAVCMFYELKR
jgi:amino-acid N-acetyltransferase